MLLLEEIFKTKKIQQSDEFNLENTSWAELVKASIPARS